MERRSVKWPWITALILCACIAVCSAVFTVIRIQDSIQPQQPDYIRQEFDRLFANPDWAQLYEMSSDKGNPFEDEKAVVAYMEKMVGDQPLLLYENPSLANDVRQFDVFCEDRLIVAFSLNKSDMSFRHINLYLDRLESVFVKVPVDVTVFVNGVALSDQYLAYSMHTKAKDYLPEGVHGLQMKGYFVSDLLMKPTVTAADKDGNSVPLFYDEEADAYYTRFDAAPQMSEEQRKFVSGAATADALYALAKVSNKELAEYIDSDSDLYKMLTENPRNYQKFQSIWMEDVQVSEYCQYSDTLFSANVTLTQKIIRTSGTLKTYYLDKTYIFELCEDGTYKVIAYTNEHLTEKVETVKLVFRLADDEMMTKMVDVNATAVTVPDMSNFSDFQGWAVETRLDDGSVLATIRILPDGTVLGGLEPMVLQPIFPEL